MASRTPCCAKLDTKVGVPPFPPKAEGDNSVLGGGDLAAAFNNDANTLKLRNFIASKENGIEPARPAYFSPHTTFDVSLYPNKTLQTIATEVLYKATAAAVRRVGPHAGQGGRGYVLDRAGQVDLGSAGPGHHAEQHRRQLPEGQQLMS